MNRRPRGAVGVRQLRFRSTGEAVACACYAGGGSPANGYARLMGHDRQDLSASIPPIVCSLTPEVLKAGRAGLLPGLRERATQAEPTREGYQLTFTTSSDTLQAITRTIDAERQCCRWLRVDLSVMPEVGLTLLTLRGPPGARDFLVALFDPESPVAEIPDPTVTRA